MQSLEGLVGGAGAGVAPYAERSGIPPYAIVCGYEECESLTGESHTDAESSVDALGGG